MARSVGAAVLSLLLLGLLGCAHTTNQLACDETKAAAPCAYDPVGGYRFDPKDANRRHTLVVVTLSGGGIRAAALAYGTLEALKALQSPGGDGALLDDVDVISSVSGGSVTAGWYASRGRDGLPAEDSPDAHNRQMLDFLKTGGTGQLIETGLNPVALARYLVTPYQRSDVLSALFADRLFGDETYAAVEDRYRKGGQPFVILNASDVGHETRFPFTQNRFDLVCSDLAGYRLADAVASSADFPLVFSAIGIRNYSDRCAQRGGDWRAEWEAEGPPKWIDQYIDRYDAPTLTAEPQSTPRTSNIAAGETQTSSPRSNGLLALREAREAYDYITQPPVRAADPYVHLLDGGLVDNLGIQSTLAIEDDAACPPGLFQRLIRPRPPAYENIDDVLYVVVNARSRSAATIDARETPPGLVTSLLGVIDTPLDSTILETQNYLTAELEAISTHQPWHDDRSGDHLSPRKTCWENVFPKSAPSDGTRGGGADIAQRPIRYQIVTIDFEMIPYAPCRDAFWELATAWTLDEKYIRALRKLPQVMLRRSHELTDFYRERQAPEPDFDKLGFPADFSGVCGAVLSG